MTLPSDQIDFVQGPGKITGFSGQFRKSPFWPLIRDLILLGIIHCIGVYVMTNWRLLDQLLSPGGHISLTEVFFAMVFLCVRMFLITFCPGWILARAFWVLTRPQEENASEK